MSGVYSEKYMIAYWDEKDQDYVLISSAKNNEDYLYTLLCHKGKHQKLKNIFKVDYKGNVTPFKDLQFSEKVRNKIRELTGK